MNGLTNKPSPSPPTQIPGQQHARNINPHTRGQTPPQFNLGVQEQDTHTAQVPGAAQYQNIPQQFVPQLSNFPGTHDLSKHTFSAPRLPTGGNPQQAAMYNSPGIRQSFYPNQPNMRPPAGYPVGQPQPNQGLYNNQQIMFMSQGQYGSAGAHVIMPVSAANFQQQRMPSPANFQNNLQSSQQGIFQVPQPTTGNFTHTYNNPPAVYYNQPSQQQNRPSSAGGGMAGQGQPSVKKRERSILSIVDPNSGKDLTQEIMSSRSTPPGQQSAVASGSGPRSTPPSSQVELSQSPQNEIAAQFAAQVAATLDSRNPGQRQVSAVGPNPSQQSIPISIQTPPMGPEPHMVPAQSPPVHIGMDSPGGLDATEPQLTIVQQQSASLNPIVMQTQSEGSCVPDDSAQNGEDYQPQLAYNAELNIHPQSLSTNPEPNIMLDSTTDMPLNQDSGMASSTEHIEQPIVSDSSVKVKSDSATVSSLSSPGPKAVSVTVSVDSTLTDNTRTTSESPSDMPLPVPPTVTGQKDTSSAEREITPEKQEPEPVKPVVVEEQPVLVEDVQTESPKEKTPEVVHEPVPVHSASVPSVVTDPSVKEIKKDTRGKKKAKELNKKGESIQGSDMDAFYDEPAESEASTPGAEKENQDPSEVLETSVKKAEVTETTPPPPPAPVEEVVPKVDIKIEDAVVTEKNEANEEDTLAVLTKYKYKEDQWSPINMEGKKQYDRDFLLQLQNAPESTTKPKDLPDIPDIIIDKPSTRSFNREFAEVNSGFDFTPRYVWGGPGSQSRSGNITKRPSGQRGRGGPGGSMGQQKQINLSIQKDIELHHAEQAWKPSTKTGKGDVSEDEQKSEELYKKARSILNKLTPQKFSTLVSQMQALEIDTEARLKAVIDLVFEKAIGEPGFSVAYANMCRCLSMFKVPSETKGEVNFRAVLLTRCQREFEKANSSEKEFITKREEIEKASTDEIKQQLKEELGHAETKAKRRSLGNIRFIGELFKLKMLTENIMHDCVFKLLRTKDEENLECLCRLLRTIGKELETDKAKPRMDQYFTQMQKLVNEKKMSSRVRFMLQDVIELRRSKWVPRRDDNNPKTIDQIHREVAKEAQDRALLIQTLPPASQQKHQKGGGRRPGQQGGPMGTGPDGWNTVSRTPIRADRSIDPSKLKLSKPNVDSDSIQLGPGGGAARFSGWSKGSTGGGARTSQEAERPSPGNRFSALSKSEKADDDSSRRVPGRGGFGRPPPSINRPSQESEKERAIAATKNIVGQRPSRERSGGREPERAGKASEKTAAPVKELTEEQIETKTRAIMDEYLHLLDTKEAITCVQELNSPSNLHFFVYNALNQVLERSEVARKQTGHLLHDLVKNKVLTVDTYVKGLNEILMFAEDMEIDIPKIWEYLGQLIGPMVQDGSVPLSFLRQACEPLKASNKAGILVAEVLHESSQREGHKKVASLWANSGLQWSDFVPKNQIEVFLVEKKLEFTKGGDSAPTTPTLGIPIIKVQESLEDMMVNRKSTNEEVFDWIEENVDDPTTKQKRFIRALMTAVCRSAITVGSNTMKVEVKDIQKRNNLLQKYLDHQAEFELQALYALQALVHKLEHPPGVLRELFDILYDEDIISEDAFIQWEKSEEVQEQEGKGVAMKQVVQFFTWLKEAEDEGES